MKVLVLGAGGFIGSHLADRLERDGDQVTRIFSRDYDLRRFEDCAIAISPGYDEIYQLAADMGGAGYTFSGANDAQIMNNSLKINLNVAKAAQRYGGKVFFASSACVYPPHVVNCTEHLAYPAAPDSEYGWEKLTSERLYAAYVRNHGLDVRIGRYHTIYGPGNSWRGDKEKVVGALCRKIAEVEDGGAIEVWGGGEQMRSFLYIDDCVDATIRLMRSDYSGPVNIGSGELISINKLAYLIATVAGKKINIRHIDGPPGVRARNSDNTLVREVLDFEPVIPLVAGLTTTYQWVEEQVRNAR